MRLVRDDIHAFDPQSGTWHMLSKAIHDEIEALRTELEQPNRLIAEHEFTRGRIAALRDVLALAEPPPAIAEAGADYGV